MRRPHNLRGNAEPERLSVRLQGLEVCAAREDGQHEFTAVAQFFDVVNDRLMVFRKGCFAKTIAENVSSGSGRVKINDAHRHSSAATLGTVIEAEERDIGVFYRGLLSSTEADIFTKMREGHVDENSIEFFSITEGVTRVPLEDVPTGAFIWDRSTGDGTVEAREMLEVAWVGIAILPFSAQGRRALLEVNCAVPFQDLPVAAASTPWDPEGAATRLRAWAGTVNMPSRDSLPNFAKLARAYLVRGPMKGGEPQLLGQIADVVDGQLVVIPDAIEAALESLAKVEQLTGPDLVACSQSAGRYMQKLVAPTGRRESAPSSASQAPQLAPAADAELPSAQASAEDPAGPAPVTTGAQPPTDDNRSDTAPAADAPEALAGLDLQVLSLRLSALAAQHPEVTQDEPTGPGREPARTGSAAV